MFENPVNYFLFGSGITTILFVVFLVYKKEAIRKKNEYIKLLELENFEIKTENQSQKYKISELETSQKHNEEKIFDKLEKLEYSRLALESEKNRLIRIEDEEREKTEELQYTKWVNHEKNVIFSIQNICKNTDINFQYFDNTNLPIDFSSQLKPDCMVKFLDQYIIFDAKKSKNPQTYIANQVKLTAEKYSKEEVYSKIYSTIFFVMPHSEISQLNKTVFRESGYTFLIISEDNIASILFLLKKIDQYDRLENFNPQERESLVNLIAEYDSHISYQNAVNFVLAKQSFQLADSKNNLPADFIKEVNTAKNQTKEKRLNNAEVIKYANNSNLQEKKIEEILHPQSVITVDVLKKSEELCKNIKIEQV